MFNENPKVEILLDQEKRTYKMLNEIVWNGEVVVPGGFVFDITLPKMLFILVCAFMFANVLRSVAVHDYEYTIKRNSRRFSDKQLRAMLMADKVNKVSATLGYFIARAGGWYYWNKAS